MKNDGLFVGLPQIDIVRRLNGQQERFIWNVVGDIDFSVYGGVYMREAVLREGKYVIDHFDTAIDERVVVSLSDGTIIEISKENGR